MNSKKIKLIPIEDEFDDYEEMEAEGGRGCRFEFDLTPYVITCAMACGILFAVRFVQKHFFKK